MTTDELKNLKAQYEKFQDKHHKDEYFSASFYVHIALLAAVFVLPKDILSALPALKNFTNLMSEIFPNIQIYAAVNDMPQLCEFYFSYIWAVCIGALLQQIYKLPRIAKEERKYFGTCEFKGRGVLPRKFIPVIKPKFKDFALGLGLLGCGAYMSFAGTLVNTFIGDWMFDELGMFLVAFLQNLIFYLILVAVCDFSLTAANIKRLEAGSRQI